MSIAIALMSGLISYYPLALYSILVLAFCRRYRLENHRIIPFITTHFFVAVFFAVSWQVIDYMICLTLWGNKAVSHFRPIEGVGVFMVYNGILIYALLAGVFYTSEMFKQYREKELNASKLQTLNKESELKVLKTQLNPHFLFNTLNTILIFLPYLR